ncbi:MAG: hypothetical protein J0H64_06710, partial [Actinobacteria bacterium]|nr:hypothetical protein [Actinomycetota bacterium]
ARAGPARARARGGRRQRASRARPRRLRPRGRPGPGGPPGPGTPRAWRNARSWPRPRPSRPARPSEEEAERIAALKRRLARVFGQDPEVHIEGKPLGVAIHTRRVRDELRSDEILDAADRFGRQAGFEPREGKRVREFAIRHSDKGAAIREIRSLLPSAPVLFLGDDTTDEDIFGALQVDDLGIKVGPGETAATERVPDPSSVAALLARLAELRTGVVIGSEPLDESAA